MKNLLVIMLILAALLTVSNATMATTTLFIGQSITGSGSSYDFSGNANDPSNNQSFFGNITSNILEFTDISDVKKIKINVNYELGNFCYLQGPPTMDLWNIQIGIPCIVKNKGLVYVTLGDLNYTEYTQFFPKHETNGYMGGVNIIATPADRLQFEFDLQKSLFGGTAKLFYQDQGLGDSPESFNPDLTCFRFKFQYVFTDNFGIALRYQTFDFKDKDTNVEAVNESTTAIGLIYRF